MEKKIIAFDTFAKFPKTNYDNDKENRKKYVEQAGKNSLSKSQLNESLNSKNLGKNVNLIEGDIRKTVPNYLTENPETRISLLHVDVDIYEPSVTIMDNLFDRVVKNGIVIFDDYGDFDGESKAVEEYIESDYTLKSMPCGVRGAYLKKQK